MPSQYAMQQDHIEDLRKLLAAKDDRIKALELWKAGSEKLDRESRELIGRLQAELAEARRDYDDLVTEGQGHED
jgi:hypothetical protein